MGIDFLVPMALSVIFAILKIVVKNPGHKADMEKALTKLRDALIAAYPPVDFQGYASIGKSSLLSAAEDSPQDGEPVHGVSNVENGW